MPLVSGNCKTMAESCVCVCVFVCADKSRGFGVAKLITSGWGGDD